ncbi:MAG: nucleotidyl transferase AbiEii/AbiGii toxin family protein [Planctomycetes bacterium]|jgi:predicted nucleotidyltransferase component of viral defense system|nr:nucleotidyl transferase AbiEii/AbiGii toxin family protein [Planctomycetota bacterium]
MKVSRERLTSESQATGFRPEVLEKVIHLLNLLEGFNRHPFLKGRLALKGGTALNLFLFDVPRLSVDIDLNYIGAVDRDTMMAERPKVEQAVQAVCSREGMNITRMPTDHAGGKWRLRYDSTLGEGGNLEVDLNFMFRVPLWPIALRDAKVGSYSVTQIPVLDLHELAAGKLAALLARQASRDLFDAHQLLMRSDLDHKKLRLGFVLYGAMNRKDWRTVSVEDVGYDPHELENQLIPVVRSEFLTKQKAGDWAAAMITECRDRLGAVLPMSADEIAFLDRILDHGEIKPELLTTDDESAERIRTHPLLQWKAVNVRQHKGQ